MKTIRLFGMVLLTILLSVGLAACGDDDDDSNKTSISSLVGTTWKIVSVTPNDGFPVGATLTFNTNQTLAWNPTLTGDAYTHWKQTESKLRLSIGSVDNDDDYLEGTFSISGSAATYTCQYENQIKEGDDKVYIMTLQKQ